LEGKCVELIKPNIVQKMTGKDDLISSSYTNIREN
jgi:hypothetical protein